jgi:hypothetical protein
MTAVQYVEHILDNNWTANITGREVDVPKPDIFRESAQNLRRASLADSDVLFLRDGGVTEVDPQSVGWTEERLVSRVTVDARTSGEGGSTQGRERLWGYRGVGGLGPNEAERYGGLQGEIKRIFDTVRRGEEEFTLIRVTEQNDLSAEMGGQVWRGTTEVILDVRANQIDPNP